MAKAPFKIDCRLGIDASDELSTELEILSIVNWHVTLSGRSGRFNTTAEVLVMFLCWTFLREGKVEVLFHIFRCPELKHNVVQVFNPAEDDIDSNFPRKIGQG